MPSFFFDTSALVKLYVHEEGTPKVMEIAQDSVHNSIVLLDLSLLEFRSAVRRQQREGNVSFQDANRVISQVLDDVASRYLTQPATPAVMEEASQLLDLCPLRAYDSLQLAGCIYVRSRVTPPLTFVCADQRLCDTAAAEGLPTLNPKD